jgi:hypothetical protein
MNNKKIHDYLIKILLKKAEGYYYTEEQEDYEKAQSKVNLLKKQYENISLFDKIDTEERKTNCQDDIINSSESKTETKYNLQDMVMVKKKITKHYIPPDMLAIKILFEIYGKEIDYDNLNNLSDNELIELKNKLIKEISNEN